MSKYLGDYRVGDAIYFSFNTRDTDGAPITLAGTPAVRVYKDDGDTEDDSGITLSVDDDGRTGWHRVAIDTSADGTFYAAGADFQVVITVGTVDGISVVGVCVGEFSIENRSALMPTTAGRKLDVSAGGEAGVDWANVGSPTTTLNLSGTTVKTATDVEADTADIQSRLPAALTGDGNIKADVLAVSGDATAADNLEAAADGSGYNLGGGSVVAASVTGNVGGNVAGSVASVTQGVSLADDAITAGKFDESTAFPLKSADTGSTQIARVGADGDTLETLSDQLDTRASQTSVDDLPTNAELATALAAADDAVLAAIAALNNLSAAAVNAEVDSAISDAALATAANLATAQTAITAIKAKTDSLTFTVANQLDVNLQAINDVALTGDGDSTPWGPA